nr:8419_t:CDS:2 [Entrophospora candida]
MKYLRDAVNQKYPKTFTNVIELHITKIIPTTLFTRSGDANTLLCFPDVAIILDLDPFCILTTWYDIDVRSNRCSSWFFERKQQDDIMGTFYQANNKNIKEKMTIHPHSNDWFKRRCNSRSNVGSSVDTEYENLLQGRLHNLSGSSTVSYGNIFDKQLSGSHSSTTNLRAQKHCPSSEDNAYYDRSGRDDRRAHN